MNNTFVDPLAELEATIFEELRNTPIWTKEQEDELRQSISELLADPEFQKECEEAELEELILMKAQGALEAN
jgi:hypothetical protein